MMDEPMVNVIVKDNEKAEQDLLKEIYDNNLKDFAFENVKHYGALIDANAFLKFSENKYGDVEFSIVTNDNLYDIYSVNGNIKVVIFKFEKTENGKKTIEYEAYTENEYIIYKSIDANTPENADIWEGMEVRTEKTDCMYVFPLGYINDPTNSEGKLKNTILEPASELFKDLILKSSDLDVSIATHGINKQFAYAPLCNYQNTVYDAENDTHSNDV